MSKVYAPNEGKAEISFDNGTTWLDLGATKTTWKISNEKQSWTPFNNGGWAKNYVTGKSVSADVEATFDADLEAHTKLQELAITGIATKHNGIKIRYTLPKFAEASTAAAKVEMVCAIEITDAGIGGGSTDVAKIAFSADIQEAPEYTKEA